MFLLMELCDKNTLATFTSSGEGLSDDLVKELCRALVDALCVFEENKIMHNDLKPDNVFISNPSSPVPKIGDMGLADFTSGRGSILAAPRGGTLEFMSPEALCHFNPAAGGIRRAISYQSDVYSLGVLLWSLKMGRNPDTPGQELPVSRRVFRDEQLRACLADMLQRDAQLRPRASQLRHKHFSAAAAVVGTHAAAVTPRPARPVTASAADPVLLEVTFECIPLCHT
jgi:serine/threonine protein kinase